VNPLGTGYPLEWPSGSLAGFNPTCASLPFELRRRDPWENAASDPEQPWRMDMIAIAARQLPGDGAAEETSILSSSAWKGSNFILIPACCTK
jgi:hypothetical protein